MGVMYDWFRAGDDERAKRVGGVVGGPAAARHPGVVETTWIDPSVKVAQLHFHVLGRPEKFDVHIEERVLPEVPIGPDNWDLPTVGRLRDDVRDSLGGVPEDQYDELGRWWATIEEFQGFDASHVADLCTSLLRLCREARERDEHVFVWSCM